MPSFFVIYIISSFLTLSFSAVGILEPAGIVDFMHKKVILLRSYVCLCRPRHNSSIT